MIGYLGDSGNAENTGAAPPLRDPAAARHPAATRAPRSTRTIPRCRPHIPVHGRLAVVPPSSGERRRARATPSRTGSGSGDRALLCDWDADGLDEPVIYREGRLWYLRTGVTEAATARRDHLRRRPPTPRCAADVDGDGDDEPCSSETAPGPCAHDFAGATAWPTGRRRTAWPATDPSSATGTATASTDLGVVRGSTWYLRSGGRHRRHRAPVRVSASPPTCRSWPTGTATAPISPAAFRDGRWYLRAPRWPPARAAPGSFVYGWSATSRSPGRGSSATDHDQHRGVPPRHLTPSLSGGAGPWRCG